MIDANTNSQQNNSQDLDMMGFHSLENVKVHIENDYLYIPGLKYIYVFIHMSRAYPIDLYLFQQFLNRYVQVHPCFIAIFLYFFINAIFLTFLYCKVFFTLK